MINKKECVKLKKINGGYTGYPVGSAELHNATTDNKICVGMISRIAPPKFSRTKKQFIVEFNYRKVSYSNRGEVKGDVNNSKCENVAVWEKAVNNNGICSGSRRGEFAEAKSDVGK